MITAAKHATHTIVLVAIVMTSIAVWAAAKDIPAQLPDPNGQPGDVSKPVQVYILAGRSNMVGMGEISGAKNLYTGVNLSSDPAVPAGPLSIYRVGNFKIAPLAVYQPDGTPTSDPVTQGLLEVPETGVFQVQCGSGPTSFCAMKLDGQQVYRQKVGGERVKQDVTLHSGKRYAFKISRFQGDPPPFWMQKWTCSATATWRRRSNAKANFLGWSTTMATGP